MKFFKSLKGVIATCLCSLMVVTGAVAVKSFAKKDVAVASEIEVSTDIQKIIDGWNNTTQHHGGPVDKDIYSAQYGEWALADGSSIKGIKLSINVTGGTDSLIRPNMLVNFNALKAGPNEVPSFGFIAQTKSGTLDAFHPHFISSDDKEGFGYWVAADGDKDFMVGGPRVYGGNYSYKTYANYFHDYPKYAYGSGAASATNRKGFNFKGTTSQPYNIWYDADMNATFSIATGQNPNKDKTYLTGLLGYDPKTYLSLNGIYENPFKDIDGVNSFTHNYTGTNAFSDFDGFNDGYGWIGLRSTTKGAASIDVILTSYAGVDLTNPQAMGVTVLTAENEGVEVTSSYNIPAPIYETSLLTKLDKQFSGKVNVYKGERAYKKKYTTFGANVTSILNDSGISGLLYENKSVGDVIDLSEVGKYTLEYIADDGEIAYSTIVAADAADLTLQEYNANIYRNGVKLASGDRLIAGDVITVKAPEGYTIFNYATTSLGTAPGIIVNNTLKRLSSGSYTLTEEDVLSGTINVTVAAWNERYAIHSMRTHYQASGENLNYVYKGIPSTLYYHGGGGWASSGKFYAMYSYDGKNLSLLNPVDGGENAVANWRKQQYGSEKFIHIGFEVNDFATKETLTFFKLGNVYEINCDIEVHAVYLDHSIETTSAFIKTDGMAGLSVKFKVNKHDLDQMAKFYNDGTVDIKAVVIPEDRMTDTLLVDSDKKPFRTPTKLGSTVTIDGKKYNTHKLIDVENYVENGNFVEFYVTLKNIQPQNYAKGYYFGAYINVMGSGVLTTGGEAFCFGGNSNTSQSLVYVNVLEAAEVGYAKNVTLNGDDTLNSIVLNGVTYYSSALQSNEIKTLVNFYNYGKFIKYVSTESVEGYTEVIVGENTYYYDAGKVGEDEVERIIAYGLAVAAGTEV